MIEICLAAFGVLLLLGSLGAFLLYILYILFLPIAVVVAILPGMALTFMLLGRRKIFLGSTEPAPKWTTHQPPLARMRQGGPGNEFCLA